LQRLQNQRYVRLRARNAVNIRVNSVPVQNTTRACTNAAMEWNVLAEKLELALGEDVRMEPMIATDVSLEESPHVNLNLKSQSQRLQNQRYARLRARNAVNFQVNSAPVQNTTRACTNAAMEWHALEQKLEVAL